MIDPASAFVWFADFDGVTCTTRARMALGQDDDPVCFGLLRRIVHDTKAVLVVSSTRRGNADMSEPNNCLDMLARYGLKDRLHPDWRTGNLDSRSLELEDWLDRNGRRPYGILDDERCDFTPAQIQRLIHTDMDFGIASRDVGRARRLAGTPTRVDLAHAGNDGAPHQAPRITMAHQARLAMAALDQGDEDTVRRLLDILSTHPLAQ